MDGHLQVFRHEFDGICIIGVDSAYFGCAKDNGIGLFLLKKLVNHRPVGQIQIGPGACDQLHIRLLCKPAANR
jgi:hypothetical protein